MISRLFNICAYLWMLPFLMIALFVFVWALLFDAYYTAFLALMVAIIFFPLRIKNKRLDLYRVFSLLVITVLLTLTIRIPVHEVDNKIAKLAEKPRVNSALDTYSLKEKLGIYGLNIMQGLSAGLYYPEISMETLLLMLPPPKSKQRFFYSDFALKSAIISRRTRHMINKLNSEKHEYVQYEHKVYWDISSYKIGSPESRYALTLNPCVLRMEGKRTNGDWSITLSAMVRVAYPQSSYVTLISKPRLRVEEGLFWVLQEAGWLFPYEAVWILAENKSIEWLRNHLAPE